jgi:hypothetical protein
MENGMSEFQVVARNGPTSPQRTPDGALEEMRGVESE